MHRKPTIVHLIQSLDNGGCENFLLRVLPLVTDYEHVVITLAREGALAPKFKDAGITVLTLGQKSVFDTSSYGRLRQLIKEQSPKLVMTYLFHADVVGRLKVQRWGYTVTPSLRTTYNDRRYWVPRLFEQLTRGRVSAYLANSEAVKHFYTQHLGVDGDKITIIPNGIAMADFAARQKSPALQKELVLPDDALIITCVANLHPNKGHTYLLAAFTELLSQHPESRLLIVGDGETKDLLKAQAAASGAHGAVHFLGRRTDVPAILAMTDIFVLPTFFEGMSNALLEAGASGCAVVTTDIPENHALFAHALFVPVKDSAHLAEMLVRLADNPTERDKMGKQIQEEARHKYDIRVVAQQLAAYYDERIAPND